MTFYLCISQGLVNMAWNRTFIFTQFLGRWLIWLLALLAWLRYEQERTVLRFHMTESNYGKKMVIVMPFAKDSDMLLENIVRWKDIVKPSAMNTGRFVDVLLYYHRDALEPQIRSTIEKMTGYLRELRVFNRVEVVSAGLSGWEDRYPLGPSNMFFKLLIENPVLEEQGYSFMFWMEPDCFPVQPGWLDKLYHKAVTSGPYWMMGSIRRDSFKYDPALAYTYEHINGNALYRLDDPNFRAYLEAVYEDFPQKLKKYLRSFDIAIYLHGREDFTQWATIRHHFVYTDLIQNVYRTPTSARHLKRKYPNTCLVHGRRLSWE